MAKLFLVRHGNTQLNSAERFWGQTDVALSAEGIRQAEKVRDRLADVKIDRVYASVLQRARVTAEIIAAGHQADITLCEELREINFGEVEGLTYAEISQRFPDFAKVLADRTSRPRFPGGESQEELNQRVKMFLPRLKQHKEKETVLIVAHSGVLRMLVCHLLKIPVRHWRQFRLSLGSLSIMETYAQDALLNLFNDVSHLQDEVKG